MEMEASPSRSDSFSHGWLRCKARPAAAFERLDVEADAGLGCSFNSSSSFIDMDPEELFSMRWTSSVAAAEEEDGGFDFGMPCAGEQCFSPVLVGAGRLLLLPCEPSSVVRDGTSTTCAEASPGSSPAFHSAQSTPASAASSRRVAKASAEAPLLATRMILLRYLRFLAPLCRKARALPARAFARRSRAALAAATSSSTPARQSTSSYASAAVCWCHGNADNAVRDAILYCKKSIQGQDM